MAHRIVTVFGGSGFLGRHLIKRLVAQDITVRVAVRRMDHAIFLKPIGNVGQIVPMSVDVNDTEAVAVAGDGADTVINLIGILFERGKRTFERLHVEGAKSIATAAQHAGVKQFIQISAIGADENSSAKYAQTKARGEKAVQDAFPGATVIRPSVIFGPEDNFFNQFASLSRISPVLPVIGCPFPPKRVPDAFCTFDLYGKGGTKFQPVYVGDVAEAIVTVLNDSSRQGKTYELGGPTVYSFKEIMELMLGQIKRQRILVPLPFWFAKIKAFFFEFLPTPILTRDQVELLKHDNVVGKDALGLKDLGITPTAAEGILPTYLQRYRVGGQRHFRAA
jgi:NADH dehydrogenase